jgi:hypothetical protein
VDHTLSGCGHCLLVLPCLLQAVRVVSQRQLKLVWRDKVLLRGRMLQVMRLTSPHNQHCRD